MRIWLVSYQYTCSSTGETFTVFTRHYTPAWVRIRVESLQAAGARNITIRNEVRL